MRVNYISPRHEKSPPLGVLVSLFLKKVVLLRARAFVQTQQNIYFVVCFKHLKNAAVLPFWLAFFWLFYY